MQTVVQAGDTVYTIAAQYGIGVPALLKANGMLRPEALEAGRLLEIPLPLHAPVPLSAGPRRTDLALEERVSRLEEGNLAQLTELQRLKLRVRELELENDRLRSRLSRLEPGGGRLPKPPQLR